MDPLYHQTSALFYEDDVNGRLLNNLGIYGNCCSHFDSFEIPRLSVPEAILHDKIEFIDIWFAKGLYLQIYVVWVFFSIRCLTFSLYVIHYQLIVINLFLQYRFC